MKQTALEIALEDYKRSVEVTRDLRFFANLRLQRRARSTSIVIAFLATYVIALCLMPGILQLHPFQVQLLLACSVILSVSIIATCLLDGSQEYQRRGELLHACARKISGLHHELKLIDPAKDESGALAALKDVQLRYERALNDCPVSHEAVDYYHEMAEKPHLFPETNLRSRREWTAFWNRLWAIWLGGAWIGPYLILIAAISLVVYSFVLSSAPMRAL